MASVAHCDLLPIGGHIYRIRTQSLGGRHHHQPLTSVGEQDSEEWLKQAAIENEEELIDESLITQESGSFITRISVDPQVLPFVIGREGHKKKEIESATGATLLIPRTSKQQHVADRAAILGSSRSETITIKAGSKAALSSARIRTELVIINAINSRLLDWTHFVSLPLSNEHTAAKLANFQQKVDEKQDRDVLSQPGAADKGFHPSIFINPKTLHLTLLMLKLYSDEARHKARQVLQNMGDQVQQVLHGRPLQLQLQGLEHMTDDPTDMHVLYLKVQGIGEQQQQLQELCELVVRSFKEAGLLVQGQAETVKLHATIINTRYRRASGQQQPETATAAADQNRAALPAHTGGSLKRERVGFSGRQLLTESADLELGKFEVPAIHLSERGAYDATGYYRCFGKLNLTYRNIVAKDGFPAVIKATTLHELFQDSVKQFGNEKLLGWRPIDKETGKAGPYQWLTYSETNEKVSDIASGLAGLGLAAGDRVGVYGMNCCEWMIAMQACNRMSYECVPLYDTLGENAVEYIIKHSGSVVVFSESKKLGLLASALTNVDLEQFKGVVYWGDGDAEAIKALEGLGLKVESFDQLAAAGKANPAQPVPPKPDDYCTIMYTSGTTGDPKGVLLKHSAVVATVNSLVSFLKEVTDASVGVGDSMLSYLPLAHIFDR
eukprot:gene12350-12484_t